MRETQVIQCKFCKKLFEAYAYFVGDQTVCADCRAEARRNSERKLELQ